MDDIWIRGTHSFIELSKSGDNIRLKATAKSTTLPAHLVSKEQPFRFFSHSDTYTTIVDPICSCTETNLDTNEALSRGLQKLSVGKHGGYAYDTRACKLDFED